MEFGAVFVDLKETEIFEGCERESNEFVISWKEVNFVKA